MYSVPMEAEEESDLKYEIARSSYGGMLHDKERNQKYLSAITKTLIEMKRKHMDAMVLDIGTGTGLLAMMAARAGATQVVACESFPPMADVARRTVKKNSLQDSVEVIQKISFDLDIATDTTLRQKPNLLVTEIFDTELLGEGVLPTLRHAHRHLLNTNCISIPAAAEAKIVLISSPSLWKSHKIDEMYLPKGNGDSNIKEQRRNCKGIASPYEVHIDEVDDVVSLSHPENIVKFDFSAPYEHPEKESLECAHSQVKKTITVTKSGSIHGVLFWWKLQMDSKGEIVLEMNPKIFSKGEQSVTWRDHWMQAVYFLPESLSVSEGDNVCVKCFFDDYSFWFDVGKSEGDSHMNDEYVKRPACDCGLHMVWTREKFRLQNSETSKAGYLAALKKMRKPRDRYLCIGEASLLPHWLLSSDCEKVCYVDCSSAVGISGAQVLEEIIGNSNLEMIRSGCIPSADMLFQLYKFREIDVILWDPNYSTHFLPWQSLSIVKLFWLCKARDPSFQLSAVVPGKALLKGIAVQFEDLWKARAPVKNVEGFDMSVYDELTQGAFAHSDTPFGSFAEADPFPLWEYRLQFLSQCFTVMEFDVNAPITESTIHENSFHFESEGQCHAIALWMEYWCNNDLVLTTGLQISSNREKEWVKHSQQGVYFLIPNGQLVKAGQEKKFSVYYYYENNDVLFNFL